MKINKCCFIGHRDILSNNIERRLFDTINQVIQEDCSYFTMGTNGDFDSLALYTCRQIKKIYPHIKIDVMLTNLNLLKKDKYGSSKMEKYKDVDTYYFDVENIHYKQKIIFSNKKMIDNCNILICYVNTNKNPSGANIALKYAKTRGLKIINLFQSEFRE